MPNGLTIANSSCLIALEAVGRLVLLEQVYGIITVPAAVANEYGAARPSWIQVRPVANAALVQSLRIELGPGEAEAIALSLELGAARVILDEKKARRIASQFNLPVVATLAVLIRAKKKGLIATVRDVLDALVAAQFRVSERLFQEVLRQAGE